MSMAENKFLMTVPRNFSTRHSLFAICNNCLWCASVFCECLPRRLIEKYFCPICRGSIEMIPLADNEVYRLEYSKKGGLELEFSLKYAGPKTSGDN
jgi:hypothetical protein